MPRKLSHPLGHSQPLFLISRQSVYPELILLSRVAHELASVPLEKVDRISHEQHYLAIFSFSMCVWPALRDQAGAYIMTYGSQIYQVFAVDRRTHLPPQHPLCSPPPTFPLFHSLLPICLPVYMPTCLPLSLPQVHTTLASPNKPIHQICFVV